MTNLIKNPASIPLFIFLLHGQIQASKWSDFDDYCPSTTVSAPDSYSYKKYRLLILVKNYIKPYPIKPYLMS